MGLGTAGLIGGLGKGLVDLGVEKTRASNQERLLKLEEAREIRLQQLRTQGQMDLNRQQGEQQAALQAQDNIAKTVQIQQQADSAAALEDKRQAGDIAIKEGDRKFQAEEGAKERASREKIAGMRANPNGKNPPGGKFTTNTIMVTSEDENGNISQAETLAVTRGGRTFVQLGTDFVPYAAGQNAKPPAKRADKGALQFLQKNPTQAEAFLERYGYLPARFITQLQGDAGAAPATEDDDE
jgi:hypothetical protein